MKKILSVILIIIIALSTSVMCFGTGNNDTCFAVASDLHYNKPSEKLEKNIDDSVFWYANRRCAMENESGFIIDSFLEECAENDKIQFVLISGDMADNGRTLTDDHIAVAEKFRKFEKETGKQIYVINGNHDASEESNTNFDVFKKIYHEFGYDEALSTRKDDCSYTANLGKKYRLIALDSNHKTKSTEDGMTADKISWVKKQTEKAEKDGRFPILMMHHNLLDHMPVQRIFSRNFIVKFHFTTAELFADWGIKLVFTGHEHCSDVTSYTSISGNKIYDFATTSLTMYPLDYRIINLSDDEIKYTSESVNGIDLNALSSSVKGYTKEQLDLMKKDLTSYSKSFLKAGIKYRLELSLSMEKLKIKENAIYYDAVKNAVSRLLELLNMPLYGENSLEQVAKEFSITLPRSEYKSVWDLATELVAYHYSGGEKFDLSSDEIQIFLKAVSVILKDDLSKVNDEVILKTVNNFLKQFGVDGITKDLIIKRIDKNGPFNKAEYIFIGIASPIIYKFAFDNDGVDDNNGILEGYENHDNLKNITSNINYLTEKYILYTKMIISYLQKAIGINIL